MLRKELLLVSTLSLVVASAQGAKADLCFRYQKSGGGTLVAKGARLPAAGSCEPLAMFETGGLAGAATGSICLDNTDGRTIIFHYTYDSCVGPGSYFESATCRLQENRDNTLPTASSSCRGTANGGGFVELDDAVLEFCTVDSVPGGGGGQCSAGGPAAAAKGFSHKKLEPATPPSKQP